MRILQLHVDFIEFTPVKKEIEAAEPAEEKKQRFEDIVVFFIAVEQSDTTDVGKRAIDDIALSLRNLKAKKALIYPYAHLSNSLAKPSDALKIVKEMEAEAKKQKIEVYRAPFGWTKSFSLSVKGHPMAEQSKTFTAAGTKPASKKLQKTPDAGKKAQAVEIEKLPENDHRVIGQRLDLFSFHEEAPGMAFFHSGGMVIRNALIGFWRKEHAKRGYQEISTPSIMKKQIWEKSGHWDHYNDNMFFTQIDAQEFAIKPMNCPGAILVYKSANRSYRDLPLRFAELGMVGRNELSGVLSGLFRLRMFTQDDAHIFAAPSQLENEIIGIIDIIDYFYKTFGFDYRVELSTKPKDAMGSPALWGKAESALKKALDAKKMSYKINPGDGAFYGPKIDFHMKDSLGRTWQLATVQVDFQMPERFGLSYIGEDGKNHSPVILHRVVYGAVERFIGILTEHYKGEFPLWLSPVQARVVSISDKSADYAKGVAKTLSDAALRVDSDLENKTMQYKVREAELQKIPYVVVVGEKESANGTIAVRGRDGKVKFGVRVDEFIKKCADEIQNKT
ncbi:MAG: threonine--tRNA ligase [Candidatus Aenigmatarchaeota archaeon]